MNTILHFLGKFVGIIDETPIVNLTGIEEMGKENPKVTAQREEVKQRMAAFGRKTILQGGEFSRNNRILMKPQQQEIRI